MNPRPQRASTRPRPATGAGGSRLADDLRAGAGYVLAFGGQGGDWTGNLRELGQETDLVGPGRELVDAARARLAPVRDELAAALPRPFDPAGWLAADAMPADADAATAALSVPGILLVQLLTLDALAAEGLDLGLAPPSAAVGHSQGLLGVAAYAGRRDGVAGSDVDLLALAGLVGAATGIVASRVGLAATAGAAPMVALTGARVEDVRDLLDLLREVAPRHGALAPVVAAVNGSRRVAVSGSPAALADLRALVARRAQESAAARADKRTGGRAFAPTIEDVATQVGFHHPALSPAVDLVGDWAGRCGLDVDFARQLAAAICVEPIDWPADLAQVVDERTSWVLDLGPGDLVGRLAARALRGRGIGVVHPGTPAGRDALFTPGGAPVPAPDWSRHAPRLLDRGDGVPVLDTAFTRLTGRSPALLAGMTPTTVDPGIVAAAANAGHWAELAGGGQVTPEIFEENVESLRGLLEPGRTAQFNTLYLDPYLWRMHVGERRLLQRARAAGAPLDGVVVSAGVPEVDEALALVGELVDAGLRHVAFKPGSVAQIRQVLSIADAVAQERPGVTLLLHIEGGLAGGHHSWESLDDLLLATYADLRARDNVVVAVGGGLGTPELAAPYLLGTWAHRHGETTMPLDGVLVGTAAMACLEATTSPSVKELLVATPGVESADGGGWVGAGAARGGISSGRSQLGADIHEVDNAASRCGRLLDEVAGDADAVAARRDEIVAALAATARPYFGDVADLTYEQLLRRYVELSTRPERDGDVWADPSWRDRFAALHERALARLHPADRGTVPAPDVDLQAPRVAIDALVAAHPEAATCRLHPADVAFFEEVCARPGKPVNFVPVLDGQVRRWWRSDSLWQAHDEQYPADGVVVIPGPVSVAGITAADEPVARLLDRFEAAAVEALRESGAPIHPARSRTSRRAGADAIDDALAARDVLWAGRAVDSPLRRLGPPEAWVRGDDPARADLRHPAAPGQAPLQASLLAHDDDTVVLTVPLRAGELAVRVDVSGARHGGLPVVSVDDAAHAMRGLLTLAAGGTLPPVDDGTCVVDVAWTPHLGADHARVTDPVRAHAAGAGDTPGPRAVLPTGFTVPDALVGPAWPAVFALIAQATAPDGTPCVEGVLDLVHLDHRAQDLALPDGPTTLRVTAGLTGVSDTSAGRVVGLDVELVDAATGAPHGVLSERFLLRGRVGQDGPPAPPAPLAPGARETPRLVLSQFGVTAPADMGAFAAVSGDLNPLHTDVAAARLAGFGAPIAHGMWLSAIAQRAAATAGVARGPRTIHGWSARWVAPLVPGADVDVVVERVGQDVATGLVVLEVTCRVAGEAVLLAQAVATQPVTALAFPGQGIQHPGMGLDGRARSAAARAVWDRADACTRDRLGFSVLALVKDNPRQMLADGVLHRHPQGVLFLTQFTQVAMVTMAVAQVAELREAGVVPDDVITCGHSVGEYSALSAVMGVIGLEEVLQIVFRRGSAMHDLVPRDAAGASAYGMTALRPSQAGVAEDEVGALVADVAASSRRFVEIVNHNLAGGQYAVAGTLSGLEALEAEMERRRAAVGGRAAFVRVPGIDVPFHSSVLRSGVPAFRARLDELLPARIDPALLVGRYVPNLLPKPFSLDREYAAELATLVESPQLAAALSDWEAARGDEAALARLLLVELLAWQFASPVRWIEVQDALFGAAGAGGLGVERFVEVGAAAAPTLANLATQTLRLPRHADAPVVVANSARDADVVLARDATPQPAVDDEPETPQATREASEKPAPAVAADPAGPSPAPVASAAPAAEVDDVPFGPADALRTLAALWTKVRADQIGAADTIEGLVEGVSSRRNQLLTDLGAELGLGAVDGAAEAPWAELEARLSSSARGYRPFGPVLSAAVGDTVRRWCGSLGVPAGYVGDRVEGVWGLGAGWAAHVTAALAGGIREGASGRGGPLGFGLEPGGSGAQAAAELVDHAVESVAARLGVPVARRSAEGGGGSVDAGALAELLSDVTGPDGVLAATARDLLRRLGAADEPASASVAAVEAVEAAASADSAAGPDAHLEAETGPEWARAVAPAFDAARALLLDDRWASAREDLARAWAGDQAPLERAYGVLDDAGRAQAGWWRDRARAAGRDTLAAFYDRLACPDAWARAAAGSFAEDVAVVTGAAPGSIGASVVAGLLSRGATVVATTSRLDADKRRFFAGLYRDHAAVGAALWVVPANVASFTDIDALVAWLGEPVVETAGGTSSNVRGPLHPSLLFPFAAPRVAGTAADAGPAFELQARVLLWGVERLVTGLSGIGATHRLGQRLHVVLPGSPNRGAFGGDGAYGECKAAFDALARRWCSEDVWASRAGLVHAHIGWVRGTGLMGGNDPLAPAVEAAGVHTFAPDEMATALLDLCSPEQRRAAARAPIVADLTGGLARVELDLPALARQARDEAQAAAEASPEQPGRGLGTLVALTHPPAWRVAQPTLPWPEIDARPEDLVVLVGAGEIGPCGSARTRAQLEVEGALSAAGVIELAWATGHLVWEDDPAGWHDADTGEALTEADILERFEETMNARCGIREFADDGPLVDGAMPAFATVYLDADTTFVVRTQQEARSFVEADPAHTRIAPTPDGDWSVTRLAGSAVSVPRRAKLTRFVGAQIPDGFDPAVWGLGSLSTSIDRLAAWNLVATVDAFVSAGVEPGELLRWLHPTQLATTIGTGMGGMASTRKLYVDALLGEAVPGDILQEALPNVVAAHTVQSYLGGYGAMIHPVAACATAAVSLEQAVDKIRVGKASVVVAGGLDDLSVEGITGFANMSATADTAAMLARGIEAAHVSRPNDRRRGGFVEGQGGGTMIVARGDVAADLGLPVLAVVAYAASFADGVHTSIPAPGLGALGAACGGPGSPLGRALSRHGVGVDDVAVVSKHDTSTRANDPNESRLHELLADALGRADGAPLFVVSQKSLTGHAKGGAAAFQIGGLAEILASGVVPPNRSLDCVDPALSQNRRLVWLREGLDLAAAGRPVRAGLVTSMGFGHVSALVALVHPGAFVASLGPERREGYLAAASERLIRGRERLADAMCGGDPLYVRPQERRLPEGAGAQAAEVAMLLDPRARLGADDRYPAPKRRR